MEKCAVCKQPILSTDRFVVVNGQKVHAGQCERYLEERDSSMNESDDSFDLGEVELL